MIKWLKYGLVGVMLLLISVAFGQQDFKEQRMKVIMREVGHEFLLQMNDSVSRILPIHKEGKRYKIEFEKSLDFEPDLLLFSAIKVFEKYEINTNSILEVEQCYTKEVVYSYEFDPNKEDAVMACRSRALPKDCYQFYFTFLGDIPPVKVESTHTENSISNWVYYIIIALLLIVVVVLILMRRNQNFKSKDEMILIGSYQFDKNGMRLIYNNQEEELSSKEADLLELLVANENKTLEREHILNVVWNDDGDYIGRTLDVSISKLRKKLQEDSNLKIINIRGVGYRFTSG